LRLTFIGDVVGKSGRRALAAVLPRIREAHAPDVVIANAENSAGGFGITAKSISEMAKAGVDFFTTGNHIWDKREGIGILNSMENILRPANYPLDAPGRGMALVPGTEGRLAVINVQGRVFMPPIDCPFQTIDRLIAEMPQSVRVVVVDMHGEATSEKIAMGWHLDGRVSMVLGTHTHVPTSDHRILPEGTAYVTDVGMTGSYDSVLGVKKDAVIDRFLHMRPVRFEVAMTDLRCDYVVADVDEETGKTTRFEHLQLTVEGS